jgi:AraC family transcriptional activator of pobA
MALSVTNTQFFTDGFTIREELLPAGMQTATDNEMCWIMSGNGALQIAGTSFPLAPGTLILIGKGQSWKLTQQHPIQAIHLVFGDCFWDRTPVSARNCKATLYGDIRAHQHFRPAVATTAELDRLFHDMLTEYQRPDYSNKADVLAAYLKILVIKVANINEELLADTNNHHYKIYQQFITLLQEEVPPSHQVHAFAKQLHIAPRKLMDICQQYSNKTPKMLISEQLIAEAKRLLQFSTMPVKEIAARLHFSTPFQFSNFFKKNTGSSPLGYRRDFAQIGM